MKLVPFFKCPGGKRRLVPELSKKLPTNFFSSNYTYVEPFAGGGALGLYLLDKNPKQKIIINDSNLHIANLWKSVKYEPDNLMKQYDQFCLEPLTKERYLDIREGLVKLNSYALSRGVESYKTFTAAHFFFINKNCFNGLIRFNKSGKFNSPYGQYKNTQKYNPQLISKVSKALQKTTIESKDFEELIKGIKITKSSAKKLFIYFDPPYVPLSATSSFTSYTAEGFNVYDQFRLKALIDFLDFLGVKIMLSNSDSGLVKTLYKDYNINTVKASRVINSKGSKRGKISEYIITNY